MASDVILEGDNATVLGPGSVTIERDGNTSITLSAEGLKSISQQELSASIIGGASLELEGQNAVVTGPTKVSLRTTSAPGVGGKVGVDNNGVRLEGASSVSVLELTKSKSTVQSPGEVQILSSLATVTMNTKIAAQAPGGITLDGGGSGNLHRLQVGPDGVDIGGPKGVTLRGPVNMPALQLTTLSAGANNFIRVNGEEATVRAPNRVGIATDSSFIEIDQADITLNGQGTVAISSFETGNLNRMIISHDGVELGGTKGVKLVGPVDIPGLRVSSLVGPGTNNLVEVTDTGTRVLAPRVVSIGVLGASLLELQGNDATFNCPGAMVLRSRADSGPLHQLTVGPEGVDVSSQGGFRVAGSVTISGDTVINGTGGESLSVTGGVVDVQAASEVRFMVPGGAFVGLDRERITLLGEAGTAVVTAPQGLKLEGPSVELGSPSGRPSVTAPSGMEIVGGAGENVLVADQQIVFQAPGQLQFMIPAGSFIGLDRDKITFLGANGRAQFSAPQGLQLDGPGGVQVDVFELINQVRSLVDQVASLERRVQALEQE